MKKFLGLLAIASNLVFPLSSTCFADVSENQAKQLIDKWVLTQNNQDFSTYSNLYSQQFSGVKKVGEKTFKFDRAGWLKDRSAMFKKPFTVTIEDIKIEKTSGGIEAGFSQKWSSKSYSDRGWKIIRLVDENGALKIIEERMKYSDVMIATPKTFQEALAKVEEVDPSWFEEAEIELTPKEGKVQFAFVRSLGEGGDEKYSGTYRSDGSLEEVSQTMEYYEHSMGEGNRHIAGELHRKYSPTGKIEFVSGKVRSEYIETKKVEGDWKINKLSDKGIDNFGIELPPLSVPISLLKQ